MVRELASVLVGILLVGTLAAQGEDNLAAAVVRLDAHGASATCVASEPGRSLLLTVAHAFQGPARNRPIVFTAPSPQTGPPQTGTRPRVVRLDAAADLALIEVQAGPLPYVLPVAQGRIPEGPQRCRSAGFDEMRWPSTNVPVTITGVDSRFTYTRERPVEGRSGGPLICDGKLVGVVVGYEVSGQRRGLYVSLKAIRSFLTARSAVGPPEQPVPAVREERIPAAPALHECPDGRCPVLGKRR
jgi:Trypsin-like peptidase domain